MQGLEVGISSDDIGAELLRLDVVLNMADYEALLLGHWLDRDVVKAQQVLDPVLALTDFS